MLLNLHIKNLALIEEAEVDFGQGLHILSGETGAGKSILIGSINLALGAKVSKDIIRNGAEYGLAELVFDTQSQELQEYFEENDIPFEDGQIIISRKLTAGKSIVRVNGETVSLTVLREIAAQLLDIHGQHDNESLLKNSKHLAMLDGYGGAEIAAMKEQIAESYRQYKDVKNQWEHFSMDEENRLREISFLEFEVQELDEADLKLGEDELLEEEYKRMSNSGKIVQGLSEILAIVDGDDGGVRELIGRAVRVAGEVAAMEESAGGCYQTLLDIEALCSDLVHDAADSMEQMAMDEERYDYIEKRLDLLNRLKLKYGKTIEEILEHKKQSEEKLEFYQNFAEEKEKVEKQLANLEQELQTSCDKLTKLRKQAAEVMKEQIVSALMDLNFLEVRFDVEFKKLESFGANGNDSIQFLISTNPGEDLKPLSKVASGGELSRIMLGFKTILAGKDGIETLIFDEIDTGISGRTAQMVSEKLKEISKSHQVMCITHLPQIASMADHHYLIEKQVENGATVTKIQTLGEEESVTELARMLGGAEITDTVLESAREMKRLAREKNSRKIRELMVKFCM